MAIQPKVTIQDFEAFIALPENSDRLFELIDGEIVEKMPTEEYGFLASILNAEIYNYLKKHPIGRVVVEVRYQLPGDHQNSRLPDVSFTSNERLQPLVKSGAVPQMPDLVIEIKSPNDVMLKMREKALYYLSNGAQLVWLVFPHKKQIEVYTADEVKVLGLDDTLDGGDVLPGFTLALQEIFTE
jgi:Uma2 family endonuclease